MGLFLWNHGNAREENIFEEEGILLTTTKSNNTMSAARKITVTAIMTAIAVVLQYIEFSVPFVPAFLKLDFSDLPALLTSFALGPVYGVLVELLKNLIHLPVSGSMMIGELSNFLLGAFFVFPAGLVYQNDKSKKGALVGSLAGALAMALASMPINYWIVYPLYGKFMNLSTEIILGMYQAILPSVKTLPQALAIFNIPFTFVKGMIDVLLTFLVYKRISPIIKGTAKG